jgi:threonine dehydrogenase-like Zn-dependent dehydrogenase
MKAAFLTGVRTIEIREVFAPHPTRDDDVPVRNKAVGMTHVGRVKPDFLATHFFKLEDARATYEAAAVRADDVCNVAAAACVQASAKTIERHFHWA